MEDGFDLVVCGGTVVDDRGRARLDVCVRDGKIAALRPPGTAYPGAEIVDADGLVVLPGMVDTHVHFMDPGDPTREDFPTGSGAAAVRGVTTVVEHTHGWPVIDRASFAEKQEHLSGRSYVDFGLAAHVWPDRIHELPDLWSMGISYFKAFTCTTHGVPGLDNHALLEVAETMASLDAPCLVHCEDDAVTDRDERALREQGRSDPGLISCWRSREAEMLAVSVVLMAARLRGARLIIAHASHYDVLEAIALERQRGTRVSAEGCLQYFLLREDEVEAHGALRKFTPPARLRSDEEERRMWSALDGGLIGHVASDHAPSTVAQKEQGTIWDVPFGLPGVDTTLPLLVDAALTGRIALERVAALYAFEPARLYRLAGKGRIAAGYDADLALIDPTATWTLQDDDIRSRAGWSPYSGRPLRGRTAGTMLRGEMIARDGALLAEERRRGRFIPGPGHRSS